ncbi:hypothetical protein E2562_038813 [Oryza meyeriana var. granulata]|uniref:Uncharacterized protein n=1 Tax=Oryza meyeriana var. granulata TaxID=110450 RepID=A0A6G1DTC1_9ORYZ|nr:hypothetical protein E2562_038813 [Oryza meyeriana var. granulata]
MLSSSSSFSSGTAPSSSHCSRLHAAVPALAELATGNPPAWSLLAFSPRGRALRRGRLRKEGSFGVDGVGCVPAFRGASGFCC